MLVKRPFKVAFFLAILPESLLVSYSYIRTRGLPFQEQQAALFDRVFCVPFSGECEREARFSVRQEEHTNYFFFGRYSHQEKEQEQVQRSFGHNADIRWDPACRRRLVGSHRRAPPGTHRT